MRKMGRPPSGDSKKIGVGLRLDPVTLTLLEDIARENGYVWASGRFIDEPKVGTLISDILDFVAGRGGVGAARAQDVLKRYKSTVLKRRYQRGNWSTDYRPDRI